MAMTPKQKHAVCSDFELLMEQIWGMSREELRVAFLSVDEFLEFADPADVHVRSLLGDMKSLCTLRIRVVDIIWYREHVKGLIKNYQNN